MAMACGSRNQAAADGPRAPAAGGILPTGGGIWQHECMTDAPADPLRLDPRVLRRRLEQAAARFDDAAVLHREVGRRLVERLDYIRLEPGAVLDLGCASGINTAALRKRYPKARYVAADLAAALVARARRRGGRWRRPPGVCTALERLPFANDSFDLIFSSLVFHRSPDLHASARELQRILRPGGVLMFATFGPDTLDELRRAWRAADTQAHVHGFVDMHDIGDALVGARLADPVMDMEHFTLTYATLADLVAVSDLVQVAESDFVLRLHPGFRLFGEVILQPAVGVGNHGAEVRVGNVAFSRFGIVQDEFAFIFGRLGLGFGLNRLLLLAADTDQKTRTGKKGESHHGVLWFFSFIDICETGLVVPVDTFLSGG